MLATIHEMVCSEVSSRTWLPHLDAQPGSFCELRCTNVSNNSKLTIYKHTETLQQKQSSSLNHSSVFHDAANTFRLSKGQQRGFFKASLHIEPVQDTQRH